MSATSNPTTTLEAHKVLSIDVRCEGFLDTGRNLDGNLRLIPIVGGEFWGVSPDGEAFHGEVLSGGADFNTKHTARYTHVLARYALRADDGTVVSVTNEGRYDKERLTRIRTAPSFVTSLDGPLAWLNTGTYVAELNERPAEGGVNIVVYRLG